MIRKVSVLILLSSLFAVSAFAQDAEPKSDAVRTLSRAYSLAFGGGSYLGVEVRDVNKDNFAELGLSKVQGVNVTKVLENSPAEKSGLQTGDVIVAFDGQSVTSTKKLTRLISEVAPDHSVNLTVMRGGSEISLPVTIGKRDMPGFSNGTFVFPKPPKAPKAPGAPDAPEPPTAFNFEFPDIEIPEGIASGKNFVWSFGARRTIGVGVTSLSKQLGSYFGVEEGKGLLIETVEEDSPAAQAGLKAGDVIIEAEGNSISSSRDLIKVLNEKKEGDVTITVIRDRNKQTVTVTPKESKGRSLYFDGGSGKGYVTGTTPSSRVRVAPSAGTLARPLIVGSRSRIL